MKELIVYDCNVPVISDQAGLEKSVTEFTQDQTMLHGKLSSGLS